MITVGIVLSIIAFLYAMAPLALGAMVLVFPFMIFCFTVLPLILYILGLPVGI